MRRREYLSTLCVALSASIAGCSSGGSESNSGGIGTKPPKEVTRSYITSYYEGDYQGAVSYTTGIKKQRISEQAVAETAAEDPTFEEILSSNKSDTEAAVSYVTSVETPIGTSTQTWSALLVKSDGKWLITRIRADDGESIPEEATAYDGIDDGEPADVARSFIEACYDVDRQTVENLSTESSREYLPLEALESQKIEDLYVNSIDSSSSQATIQTEVHLTSPKADEEYERYWEIVLEDTGGEWEITGIDISTYD